MEPPQTENNDEKSNIDINEDLLNDDANQNDENLNENNPETNEIETETNPIQTEDNPLILPPITNINIKSLDDEVGAAMKLIRKNELADETWFKR